MKNYDLSYYTFKCANEIGMMLYYKKDIVEIKEYLRILQQIENLYEIEKNLWELCMKVVNISNKFTLNDVRNIFKDNRELSDEELSELDNENIVDRLDETLAHYQELYSRKSSIDSITKWLSDFNYGKDCDTDAVINELEKLDIKKFELNSALDNLEDEYKTETNNQIISTSFDSIDDSGAVFRKGTVNTVFGYTGSFKTMYCTNMVYEAIKSGLNVCYLSLEISETNMYYNILSRHSNEKDSKHLLEHTKMKQKSLSKSEEKYLFNKLLPDFKDKLSQHLIILDECKINNDTYADFNTILKTVDDEFINRTGSGVDVVVLDHINLLKFGMQDSMNDYSKVNHWMSYFRKNSIDFVHRKKPVCFVIVAQSSRSGFDKAKSNDGIYTLDAIAEGNEIERSSSVVLSIYADAEMKSNNTAYVQVLKGRDCGEMVNPIAASVIPRYYLFKEEKVKSDLIEHKVVMFDENGGGYGEKNQ